MKILFLYFNTNVSIHTSINIDYFFLHYCKNFRLFMVFLDVYIVFMVFLDLYIVNFYLTNYVMTL